MTGRFTNGIVLAAALSTGCATVVKGDSQDLSVVTDPTGAACTLMRKGQTLSTVDPTPGMVKIGKSMHDLQIKCAKSGFKDTEGMLPASFEAMTVGNILIGGLIGVAIDAGSGAMYKYEGSIFVKLEPEAFKDEPARRAFYDEWQVQVMQESMKARRKVEASCPKDQCEAMLTKIDAETRNAMEQIQAMRGGGEASAAAEPVKTAAAPVAAVAPAAAVTRAALASAAGDGLRTGDRWRYRLLDRRRQVATITVQVVDQKGGHVTERITREDDRGFVHERLVDTTFAIRRFEDPVAIPGGYKLIELAPYGAQDAGLQPNRAWNAVAGDFSIPGGQGVAQRVRVIGREKLQLPAGEFSAWKVESESGQINYAGGYSSVRCTYWYSPDSLRVVKMRIHITSTLLAANSDETYELLSFERSQ